MSLNASCAEMNVFRTVDQVSSGNSDFIICLAYIQTVVLHFPLLFLGELIKPFSLVFIHLNSTNKMFPYIRKFSSQDGLALKYHWLVASKTEAEQSGVV